MTHYQDIHILADPDLLPQQLMSDLFGRIHKALALEQCDSVGLSFPKLKEEARYLGSCLRLHGTETSLAVLQKHLGILPSDYFLLSGVKAVPAQVEGYRRFSRRQSDSSLDRLRRRKMKREGISWEAAVEALSENREKRLELPYVNVRSASNGERFRLFIEAGPIEPEATLGTFSCYGLSPVATVPWF
ncbi:type I-F CRISPR-associated endoribonuclease Cas6/Csy4 [Mailhella sp.]